MIQIKTRTCSLEIFIKENKLILRYMWSLNYLQTILSKRLYVNKLYEMARKGYIIYLHYLRDKWHHLASSLVRLLPNVHWIIALQDAQSTVKVTRSAFITFNIQNDLYLLLNTLIFFFIFFSFMLCICIFFNYFSFNWMLRILCKLINISFWMIRFCNL